MLRKKIEYYFFFLNCQMLDKILIFNKLFTKLKLTSNIMLRFLLIKFNVKF